MTRASTVERGSVISSWFPVALMALGVAAALLGCKKESTSLAAEQASQQAVAPAAAAKASADRFDEAAFALKIVPDGTYEAGKPGKVQIELLAKSGFKCNDQYPYKFKAKESPGIEYESPVIKKDRLRLDGKSKAVMTVGFTPKSAGKKTVAGQFAFSVCTEEQCLVERRDLALDVNVK